MPLISLSSLKGGQGKSLLAAAVASALDATLLDLDHRQGDSQAWARAAGRPCNLVPPEDARGTLLVAAADEGWYVADCPPAESDGHRYAVFAADLVVVPLAPGGAQDARGWYRQVELLREAKAFREGQGLSQAQAVVLNRHESTAMASAIAALVGAWADPSQGRHYLGAVARRVGLAEAYQQGLPPQRGRFGHQLRAVVDQVLDLTTHTPLTSPTSPTHTRSIQ